MKITAIHMGGEDAPRIINAGGAVATEKEHLLRKTNCAVKAGTSMTLEVKR
jgi:hypothetical protein